MLSATLKDQIFGRLGGPPADVKIRHSCHLFSQAAGDRSPHSDSHEDVGTLFALCLLLWAGVLGPTAALQICIHV